MKKVIVLLAAAVLLFTACSSNGNSKPNNNEKEVKEVTAWAWDKNFNVKALEIAQETYAADHPEFKINVIENAQDDIVQKLNTALGSGTMKGLPNIVLIEDYRAQGFLKSYPDLFYDLSGKFKASDFAEYKLGPTSFDGKNFGLPFDSGVTGLFVRTDYLEQAGYTTADLNNIDWKQFIEIGKKVKEATGKDWITADPNDLGIVRIMIQTAGSWYMKEDGSTPNLNGNAELKEALQLYKEMLESNITKPISDWNEFLSAFNGGDVAAVPSGNWISASIKAEASQSGKWAVVPIPRLPGEGSVNASNLGGSSWYVLNIVGKEKAADFLVKTFGSNVDFYQKILTDVGANGTYKPAAAGEAYQASDEFYGNQNVIADFAKWTAEIPRVNYGMHTYAIEDILVAEVQNYMNGKDIDKVLEDAQKQAETQLK